MAAAVTLDNPRLRLYAAVLILGVFAQVAQAVLIREGLVVFYGNEISLGAFFGSWLLWLAVGSVSVVRLRERRLMREPLTLLRWVLLALPLVLLAQVVALRTVRGLLHASAAEFVPLGELFLALFVVTAPSSLLLGIAFPLACQVLTLNARQTVSGAVGAVSALYALDSLGALFGGTLFTFVLVQWLGVAQTLGLSLLALGATALLLPTKRPWPSAAAAAAVLVGAAAVATPLGAELDRWLEQTRFARLQPGVELLEAVETRYGHLAVGRAGGQYAVVRDGRIADSFPLREEVEQQAAYFSAQAVGGRRVLLVGGSPAELPGELLRYPLERIDLVEEDRRAFERIRGYLDRRGRDALEDPRLRVHFGDGRRFVNGLPPDEDYDLILVLGADPSSASSNRYFTREFYARIRSHLSPEGVFCTQVSSASNYLGGAVRSYSGSVFRTLGEVFPHIALMPGDVQVYCAALAPERVTEDPGVLEARYLAMPLDEHRFPAASFRSLLPADRIRFVRAQLGEAGGELNTDARPVTYYLNMVLWGKLTASGFVDWLERLRILGPWPYLVPLILFLGLWLLRSGLEGFQRPRLLRQSGGFALVVLGLISMAVQLSLLLGYQAHVGFMFERVALLNGVFMTGLALGAGALGRRLAAGGRADLRLAGILGLVALGVAVLPDLLDRLGGVGVVGQESAYLLLCFLVGLVTGAGFPLGVHLAQSETGQVLASSGLSEGADSLGGALGGLLTGALLVPLLGVRGTCYLLAAYGVVGVLPLLFARYAPEELRTLRIRGGSAFPWPRLSWALVFLVVLAFAWNLLSRGAGSAPQVHFDQGLLEAVTGSTRFELNDKPFDWYRGSSPDEGEGATAALSSMAAAPDVRGYAGPLNLLIGVGADGVIRGVRYIDSGETPAYIADIGPWLARLAGLDLGSGALSLDRVDALSGATVTSRAALEAINRSARAVAAAAFGRDLATAGEVPRAGEGLWTARFLVTLGLLAAFFPIYLRGGEGLRLVYLGAALAILGLWLNSLVTEVDLVNLSLGNWASWEDNPQRWLLLGFVLVTGVLFGQAWCGYLCPFGALQELVSRLGRRLGLRTYPDRALETRVRYLKFLLLALVLVAVWLSGETLWASFNPMQHAFGGHWTGWMLALVALSLVGSLFYFRFWCRYFCPFGAFLALTNKLALLRRLAPSRRFEHCDLGVREEYDLDCIQCHRCLTGLDTRVRPHRRTPAQTPGADGLEHRPGQNI